MTRYPSERLAEEVASIAHYFHWSYDEIMSMDHHERQRWVEEAARFNQRMSEQTS